MLVKSITLLSLASLGLCDGIFNSFQTCLTQVGTVSRKRVPTSHSTLTIDQPDITVKITIHPTISITLDPASATATTTKTVYTQPFVQDPALTTTLNLTSFVRSKQTVTTTTTSTVFHTASYTTTIPTPSGFLPIADTTSSVYPGSGNAPWNNVTVSASAVAAASLSTSSTSTKSRKGRISIFNQLNSRAQPTQFPQAVNCKFDLTCQDLSQPIH